MKSVILVSVSKTNQQKPITLSLTIMKDTLVDTSILLLVAEADDMARETMAQLLREKFKFNLENVWKVSSLEVLRDFVEYNSSAHIYIFLANQFDGERSIDGFIEKTRSKYPDVVLIAMSGDLDYHKQMEQGCQYGLPKPFRVDEELEPLLKKLELIPS